MKKIGVILFLLSSTGWASPVTEEERERYPDLYRYYEYKEEDGDALSEDFKKFINNHTYLKIGARYHAYHTVPADHGRGDPDPYKCAYCSSQRLFIESAILNERRRLSLLRKINEIEESHKVTIELYRKNRDRHLFHPRSVNALHYDVEDLSNEQAWRLHQQLEEIEDACKILPPPLQKVLKSMVMTPSLEHFLEYDQGNFFKKLQIDDITAAYHVGIRALYLDIEDGKKDVIDRKTLAAVASRIYEIENPDKVRFFENHIADLPFHDLSFAGLNFHDLVSVYAMEVFPIRQAPELIEKYLQKNSFAAFLFHLDEIDTPLSSEEFKRWLGSR